MSDIITTLEESQKQLATLPTAAGAVDEEELLHIATAAFEKRQALVVDFSEDAVQAVIDAVRPYLAAAGADKAEEELSLIGIFSKKKPADKEDGGAK